MQDNDLVVKLQSWLMLLKISTEDKIFLTKLIQLTPDRKSIQISAEQLAGMLFTTKKTIWERIKRLNSLYLLQIRHDADQIKYLRPH